MTLLLTKGWATSSVLTHQLIFALHEGQTTGWEAFTLVLQTTD